MCIVLLKAKTVEPQARVERPPPIPSIIFENPLTKSFINSPNRRYNIDPEPEMNINRIVYR